MIPKISLRAQKSKFSHVLYKTGDRFIPVQIKDRNGEVVLKLCKVCGKAENELNNTECCIIG